MYFIFSGILLEKLSNYKKNNLFFNLNYLKNY